MAKKHFIIYYKQGTGTYIITEPKPWSRENQHYFSDYDFINNSPTTNTIIKYLKVNFNFITIEYPRIKLTYNHDPEVDI